MAYDRLVTDELDLEFDGELLVPRLNLVAYHQIYALEGWLRRLCLTVWMCEFGDRWIDEIDPSIRRTLVTRSERNRRRLYLGAESHTDLIWETTHGELIKLLTSDKVAGRTTAMTGAEPVFIQAKLDEIREIRNLLAHNRALSRKTHVILAGLLASLEDMVDSFKRDILYGPPTILDGRSEGLGSYFDHLLKGNNWSKFQAFVALRGDLVEFVSLPVERDGSWPDAKKLLQAFHHHLYGIVAFCLNKSGNEFSVVIPIAMGDDFHHALADTFTKNPSVWSTVDFEGQEARYVCSPKIWFYENRAPS